MELKGHEAEMTVKCKDNARTCRGQAADMTGNQGEMRRGTEGK